MNAYSMHKAENISNKRPLSFLHTGQRTWPLFNELFVRFLLPDGNGQHFNHPNLVNNTFLLLHIKLRYRRILSLTMKVLTLYQKNYSSFLYLHSPSAGGHIHHLVRNTSSISYSALPTLAPLVLRPPARSMPKKRPNQS